MSCERGLMGAHPVGRQPPGKLKPRWWSTTKADQTQIRHKQLNSVGEPSNTTNANAENKCMPVIVTDNKGWFQMEFLLANIGIHCNCTYISIVFKLIYNTSQLVGDLLTIHTLNPTHLSAS